MGDDLYSKIKWYSLPKSSMEEKLDLVYKVAKGNAKFLGIDINNIMDLFYKSMDDYKAKYNGKSKNIDLKKYAIGIVDNHVTRFAKTKEIEEYIKYEKMFRRNQLYLF